MSLRPRSFKMVVTNEFFVIPAIRRCAWTGRTCRRASFIHLSASNLSSTHLILCSTSSRAGSLFIWHSSSRPFFLHQGRPSLFAPFCIHLGVFVHPQHVLGFPYLLPVYSQIHSLRNRYFVINCDNKSASSREARPGLVRIRKRLLRSAQPKNLDFSR
jgi:hypothetical protein